MLEVVSGKSIFNELKPNPAIIAPMPEIPPYSDTK
tara:strand:+ start:484 stop:588 length:105 start_codon:yes stop_codon:yes gene_type:complete